MCNDDLKFHYIHRRGKPLSIGYHTRQEHELTVDIVWELLVEHEDFFGGSYDVDMIHIVDLSISDDYKEVAYVTVEDLNYQVDDAEANRTFAIAHATPGIDGSGIEFEEL